MGALGGMPNKPMSWQQGDVPWWNDIVIRKLKQYPLFIQHERMKATTYHRQPGIEIHITRQGSGMLMLGGQLLLQAPGQVVMFRGEVPHQLRADDDYRRTVICLEPDKVPVTEMKACASMLDFFGSHSLERSVLLTPAQFRQLDERCQELEYELSSRLRDWERMSLAITLDISLFLERCEISNGREQSPRMRSKHDLVQECVEYIRTHLGEDLTLQAVARTFAVSEAYLTRCFSKAMQVSFYQYVLLQRVAEAKRLLREEPNRSVSDIAYSLGFSSSSNLTRTFRAVAGVTPSAYRGETASR